ncbi:MAG: hypothetical protein IJF71_07480 [Clostridia bacterium]|nr:hypothetical protein [Clostridia bacterium]
MNALLSVISSVLGFVSFDQARFLDALKVAGISILSIFVVMAVVFFAVKILQWATNLKNKKSEDSQRND